MSSTKRQKIDPSPSPQPSSCSLRTRVSKQVAWLYEYTPSPFKDANIFINNIIPKCGVNFMEKVYHYDKSKETSDIFELVDQHDESFLDYCRRNQLFYPGYQLTVIAPKKSASWLRFILFDRNRSSKPNMMSLYPIAITLEGRGGRVDLVFHPGVQCFCANQNHAFIEGHVIYHTLFTNTDASWSSAWGNILKPKSPLKVVGIKALPNSSMGYEVDYKKLQNPFTLVSNDGVKRVCHKDVLCDRSPYFAKELIKKCTENQMVVSESSHATNLLLEHIYNPLIQLPELTLEELCGVLKLAFEFQLFDLIATISNRLFGEIDKADLKSTWYLTATLHPLRHKVQIVCNLWASLLLKIRRCILKLKSEYIRSVRFDDQSYFLNLKLFAKCGPAKYEVLKGLSSDLERKVDEESPEDFLKLQLLFKRFLSEVLVESLKNKPQNSAAGPLSSGPT